MYKYALYIFGSLAALAGCFSCVDEALADVTTNSAVFDQQPKSHAFTVPTLSTGCVIVGAFTGDSNDVTALTIGGVSTSIVDAGATYSGHPGALFALASPPSGSQTFLASSPSSGDLNWFIWYLDGCDQTSPVVEVAHSTDPAGASITTSVSAFIYALGAGDCPTIGPSPFTHETGFSICGNTKRGIDSNGMQNAGTYQETWTSLNDSLIFAVQASAGGGGGASTTVATTTIMDNPVQDTANGFFIFLGAMFFGVYFFKKRA